MEAIKKTVDELSQHFHNTMAEFQQNLQSVVPATSPSANIAAQFSVFRNFVLSALKRLQGQVEVLSQQMDHQETRSTRKILLLHGVPEKAKESATVVKILTEHLRLAELSDANISHCQRMGQIGSGKSRPILIKFHDLPLRNTIWFGKRNFKGSGFTLAEFLTKSRHEVFMAARLQYGISKCWTKDGQIIIIDPTGKRHCITTKAGLYSISAGSVAEKVISPQGGPTAAAPKPQTGPTAADPKPQAGTSQVFRSKRVVKK